MAACHMRVAQLRSREGDVDHCDADQFVEVQTLGGVYIDDIARVIFDAEPEPDTVEALQDKNMEWTVADVPLKGPAPRRGATGSP